MIIGVNRRFLKRLFNYKVWKLLRKPEADLAGGERAWGIYDTISEPPSFIMHIWEDDFLEDRQ